MKPSNFIWIILPFCLLALAKFVLRGPVLAVSVPRDGEPGLESTDFKTFYAASRAWSDGMNPYDHAALNSILNDAGAAGGHTWEDTPSICPLTTYAILSPIAQLSWRSAKLLWCLLNLTSLAVLLACLCQLAGFSRYGLRSLVLLAGVLALQPTDSVFRFGQLSLLVAALGTAAIVLSMDGRDSAGGVFGAFAFALKPQVALAFLIPNLLCRRWRSCFVALLTLTAIAAAAVLRMHAQTGWLSSWLWNLRSAFGTGVNSIDPSSPHHRNMINLQYPLRLIMNDMRGVNALVFGIAVTLALPLLPFLFSGMESSGPALLQSVSLLAVVQLLMIYHRDYDAVLLALPLAWALSPRTSPRQARPAIVLIAVFFVPLLHVLYRMEQSSVLHPLSSSLLWQFVVWPYQTWGLLGLAAWLSYCYLAPGRGISRLDRGTILSESEAAGTFKLSLRLSR